MSINSDYPELTLDSYPGIEATIRCDSPEDIVTEYEAPTISSANFGTANSPAYVAAMQKALNQILGLRLPADGALGPQTRSAIRSFQQRAGLSPDGVVGPATEAALKAALAHAPALRPGAAPRPVAGPVSPSGALIPGAQMFFGLDMASVDGNTSPDWVKAKGQGPISFAIIRANYGDWRDPIFRREWPRMKEAGILRGAYLFLRYPKVGSPLPAGAVAQAKAFIETVGALDPTDLPPSLDVEFPGGRAATGRTAQQLLDNARAAWKVLKERYGVAPIIYTSGRVWREDLSDLPAPDLTESPLWLTPYPFGERKPAVLDPKAFAPGGRYTPPPIPKPWGDRTNWWIHQYEGDARGIPGFHQADLNVFHTTTAVATGDRVKWVQRRLGVAQSGSFDAATQSALASFQSHNGLPASLVIDPRTFASLCWSNP